MTQIISTLTSKSQTVIPQAIRKRMNLEPGDRIRYVVRGNKVEIEKLVDSTQIWDNGAFSAFTEWASARDDAAFAYLQDH